MVPRSAPSDDALSSAMTTGSGPRRPTDVDRNTLTTTRQASCRNHVIHFLTRLRGGPYEPKFPAPTDRRSSRRQQANRGGHRGWLRRAGRHLERTAAVDPVL